MRADWRFRLLLEIDLERQCRWLNATHVNRWWNQRQVTRESVRAKYLPRIRGEQKTQCLVALFEGRPAGYVQTYRIDDHADYAPGFVLPRGGWAFDWFIGEPDLIGHGHGARLLEAFVSDWLWAHAEVVYAVVGSRVENLAALKSYERAHFVPWFSIPPRATAERYYRRDRRDDEGWSKKKK